MQKRHTDRLQYFFEQSESTRKYVLPYILDGLKIDVQSKTYRVLEIGCGEGGNLLPFLEKDCECWGVELSEISFENATKFYADNPLKSKLHLRNKNIYDVNSNELGGTFDIVFLRDVIEHIPEQERFMKHLKQFVAPQGVVFFAFPPWRMPFGGHQQVISNKLLNRFPYIHLLPKFILKCLGMSKNDVDFLKELSKTGIGIRRFEKILTAENYEILKKTHWLINPNYEIKFGLKPRKLYKFFQFPWLKDFYTTAMYYLVTNKKNT
jgi:SAM-dependent methyltransferase